MTSYSLKKNKMSKNLLFLLVLATFSFTISCSDDDILETINETFIIGKWQLSNTTENGENIHLNDCQLLKTLEFNKKNEVIITTFEIDTDNVCETNSVTTHNYTINHSTITIDETANAEISTPKSETLILTSEESSNNIVRTYTRQ